MKTNAYPHNRRTFSINIRSLSIATTLLAGLLYIVCAIFVALAPQSTMAFFGYVSHLDLLEIAQPITWKAFFVGLIFFALGTGLSAAFVGYYYNRLSTR
ncbi:DUF5676 family membrane protein [Oscillatoria sp. CS-180]|nr:DUF5676 family membrane protein [Oscillatoria sp. CS-180]